MNDLITQKSATQINGPNEIPLLLSKNFFLAKATPLKINGSNQTSKKQTPLRPQSPVEVEFAAMAFNND